MMRVERYLVRVDHLSDQQLNFFGWFREAEGEEFSIYWHPHSDERQPVSNVSPRYLVVDDWNDAEYMSDGEEIVVAPHPDQDDGAIR